ncbi:class I SAM-dependent methyltransferase [Methanospirillum hungatei]|uniref:small ribosomal subunit Rsm22 family protein n=1 Tax=Methanospirillum hungatei TaxID=2203 RepID=UPI0026EAE569|nr:class I SAM-dependent methyltransferase [Methanospirillum hungatei]MCA1917571.1 class I SAM-dependent methyltransferase [Methanospirillum hungatei]
MNSDKPFTKFHKKNKTRIKKKDGELKSESRQKSDRQVKYQRKLLKIPSRLERLIEKYIENKTGKPVDTPATIERIRQSVLAQKAGYWSKTPHAKYGRGYDVFAYLSYQAPGYIIQFHYIIQRLDKSGLLPEDLKVLDLGTGPGVVPLALTWFMKERKKGTLTIDAIEQSEEFIEAFKFLVPEFASESLIKTDLLQHADIRSWQPKNSGTYTMITCQNVLAELPGESSREKADLLIKYCSSLTDDGILILVEPAELRHSTELRILQKNLERSGLFLLGPCRYIHPGPCEPDTCWSFAELSELKPPRLMELLSEGQDGYRFLNTDIKFSYSILTKKPLAPVCPNSFIQGTIPLGELEDYLGETVTIAGAKMSMDIGNREFAIFLICDGSGGAKVYLIIPRSLKNQEITSVKKAEYGDILKISEVRVRWNPKKGSYNLVAGARTQVSAMHK